MTVLDRLLVAVGIDDSDVESGGKKLGGLFDKTFAGIAAGAAGAGLIMAKGLNDNLNIDAGIDKLERAARPYRIPGGDGRRRLGQPVCRGLGRQHGAGQSGDRCGRVVAGRYGRCLRGWAAGHNRRGARLRLGV